MMEDIHLQLNYDNNTPSIEIKSATSPIDLFPSSFLSREYFTVNAYRPKKLTQI